MAVPTSFGGMAVETKTSRRERLRERNEDEDEGEVEKLVTCFLA